jgi:two-component system sensor histidine kinase BaeS
MEPRLSSLSLRAKLVLSYLAVTLGAILMLSIVVSIAIQNSFANSQREQFLNQTENLTQNLGLVYASIGSWDRIPLAFVIQTEGPTLLTVVDSSGGVVYGSQNKFLFLSNDDEAAMSQALQQALHGQTVQGNFQSSSDDGSFNGMYIAMPVYNGGQSNEAIVGAIFMAQPQRYPEGYSPYDFLTNVNQAILISGFIATLVVVIISLFLVRRLTRPLASLTAAAEQMRRGDYSRRVEPPRSQDELGRLSQSFNQMAETIESDITELRRQEQLRRDLLANIAHDLATPLTAIQGFSEALGDDVISDPAARQETAQLIAREVQRMRRLVADMQQMTSLESGRVRLDLAPLDIHGLVDETLAVIGPECEQAGIALRNEIDPRTPLVLADSDRVTQVLLNLLDNARRHTPSGGTISVGAQLRDRMLSVWVSDSGTGIDPTDLPLIFERFYRADRSRTGTTGGSGLGLAIVKAIIEAHGGIISAESAPGQGTRVTFNLPLAPTGAINRPDGRDESAPTGQPIQKV